MRKAELAETLFLAFTQPQQELKIPFVKASSLALY